jgi:four helix bundle protein
VMGDQMLRSGTSVGAHFREAQRAKSNADFISKIEGGMQELEETVYWLELLEETGVCASKSLAALKQEADELMAIFVTIVRQTKAGAGKAQGLKTPGFSALILILLDFPLSSFIIYPCFN